jgi:hypothetical protein
MAELTPLEEKIAEVLGLAQAAQDATAKVAKLVEDQAAREVLDRMNAEATETRERCDVDGLDGFEFLVIAEAGELGHWEIVREMNEQVGSQTVRGLTEFAIPVQERHFQQARDWSLRLAREEVAAG